MANTSDLLGALLKRGMTDSSASRIEHSLSESGIGGPGGILEQLGLAPAKEPAAAQARQESSSGSPLDALGGLGEIAKSFLGDAGASRRAHHGQQRLARHLHDRRDRRRQEEAVPLREPFQRRRRLDCAGAGLLQGQVHRFLAVRAAHGGAEGRRQQGRQPGELAARPAAARGLLDSRDESSLPGPRAHPGRPGERDPRLHEDAAVRVDRRRDADLR